MSRMAIVHDRIVVFTGSEKCALALTDLYPDADFFTLFYDRATAAQFGTEFCRRIRTSFLQRMPCIRTRYEYYLPVMPLAVEGLDMRGYDTVISNSHTVAHGVITSADQLHVSYTYTPMRYGWDLYHEYLEWAGLQRGLRGLVAQFLMQRLRIWDQHAAQRVDHFVGISRQVVRRIAKAYGREATLIWPCVDVGRFRHDRPRDDFYLTVGRMVPYKRTDLIIQAFNKLQLPLVVIGGGPLLQKMRALAGPTVTLLGPQNDQVVNDHLQRCRGFIFAANEDFGIAPVEALAAGAPVIGYGRGGLLDTIVDGEQGVHFPEQTPESLAAAVLRFAADRQRFEPGALAAHAERFSAARFRSRMARLVALLQDRFQREGPAGVRCAIPPEALV